MMLRADHVILLSSLYANKNVTFLNTPEQQEVGAQAAALRDNTTSMMQSGISTEKLDIFLQAKHYEPTTGCGGCRSRSLVVRGGPLRKQNKTYNKKATKQASRTITTRRTIATTSQQGDGRRSTGSPRQLSGQSSSL